MYTSLERNGTSGHPIDILQGTVLISLAPVLYCGQKSVEQHKKNVYQSTIEVYFQYIDDIFNKHVISTDISLFGIMKQYILVSKCSMLMMF